MEFTKHDAEEIIIKRDIQLLVKKAKEIGEQLKKENLTTTQIRNFFTEVRTIQNSWSAKPEQSYRSVIMLKPKLAYAAQRSTEVGRKTQGVKILEQILSACIDQIMSKECADKKEGFNCFVDFFEAILAYHKSAGGKEY